MPVPVFSAFQEGVAVGEKLLRDRKPYGRYRFTGKDAKEFLRYL